MRLPNRRLANSLFVGSLLFPVASRAVQAPADRSAPVPPGQTLPDILMLGLNGSDRRLGSFVGRKMLINVWASWCGPCRAEAASLERMAWSKAGMAYSVIGVSTDDDRRAAERWLKQSNATLSHFIDQGLVIEHLLGASTIPLTVLVDEKLRVVTRIRGARDWDTQASAQLIQREFAGIK
jgi:thiol-disulfide isomerase/thioredoxin